MIPQLLNNLNGEIFLTRDFSTALPSGLQHETKCKEFKMSQQKIKESSLKGPSLLFSCVPLPHFER